MKNAPRSINKLKSITTEEVFKQFLALKKAQKVTNSTISYYTLCWNYFTTKNELEIVNNITHQHVIHFINSFDNLSTASINSYLRGVRTILKFCFMNEYVKPFDLKLIKEEEVIKNTYTDAEIEALLKKPNTDKCNFKEYASWVLVNFLLGTGARRGTITNMKINDLDFENCMIIYRHTKSKKQQLIPMSKTLNKVLLEYLTFRGAESDDEYLFCNSLGEQLGDRRIQHFIADYNHSRGVAKTSIHLFRHTFAKVSVLNGVDPFRLQKILGHSTLDMTRKYCNLYGNDLKEGFNDYNPLEKFSSSTGSRIKMKK